MVDTNNSHVKRKCAPVVDRNKCEGKEACVQICPYNVFSIKPITATDRSQLTIRGRIKAWVHGGKQAYVTNPQSCHGCKLCISACPEKALKLAPTKIP